VAGCSTALKAAERGLRVTVLTSASDPHDCNSFWAQGGIIYKAKDDKPALLAQDIMTAGASVWVCVLRGAGRRGPWSRCEVLRPHRHPPYSVFCSHMRSPVSRWAALLPPSQPSSSHHRVPSTIQHTCSQAPA
jgi:glycine/D-amino acid oxidase-like deaminating enzyme